MIKISIVVLTKNNQDELNFTLNSLKEQTCKENIELILVNGGDKLKYNYKDLDIDAKEIYDDGNGIYHAMNIGAKIASGSHILFLNSGDRLISKNSIKNLNDLNLKEDYGYFLICKVKGVKLCWRIPSNQKNINSLSRVPVHQAILFHKTFYKNNFYDTSFKIAADYKYKINFLKNEIVKFIPFEFSEHTLGGISSTYNMKNYILIAKELYVIDKNYQNLQILIFNQVGLLVKFFLFQFKLIYLMEILLRNKYIKTCYEIKI